jgi:hypothetical protein
MHMTPQGGIEPCVAACGYKQGVAWLTMWIRMHFYMNEMRGKVVMNSFRRLCY